MNFNNLSLILLSNLFILMIKKQYNNISLIELHKIEPWVQKGLHAPTRMSLAVIFPQISRNHAYIH